LRFKNHAFRCNNFFHILEVLPALEDSRQESDCEQRSRERHILSNPSNPVSPRGLPARLEEAPRELGLEANHRGLVSRIGESEIRLPRTYEIPSCFFS
jgi:hypothetical protein